MGWTDHTHTPTHPHHSPVLLVGKEVKESEVEPGKMWKGDGGLIFLGFLFLTTLTTFFLTVNSHKFGFLKMKSILPVTVISK